MHKNNEPIQCPLCESTQNELFHEDKLRPYFQCATCRLVFIPKEHHLAPDAEKSCYDCHKNNPEDAGYRQFLNRLYTPMHTKLKPGMRGLDFGCGPGPALAIMFQEGGFPCEVFDPFYANNPAVLESSYDFLSCTEAIEHFHHPRKEFELFLQLVRPNGWIGIMTQFAQSREHFKTWSYTADITHVCYFSEETFRWLAYKYNLLVEFPEDSVALFQRQ